jgi:hypothetical protein
MAKVIDQEAAARAAGGIDAAGVLKDEQIHSLQEHLLQWGPILGRLLAETAQSPFLPGARGNGREVPAGRLSGTPLADASRLCLRRSTVTAVHSTWSSVVCAAGG